MYEDLIKRLRDAAKMSEALAVLLPHSEGNATAKLYKEAADAIEEFQERVAASEATIKRQSDIIQAKDRDLQRSIDAKPQWIPVTERLPDEYVSVLCYCSRNGQYGCGERCKEDNGTIYWIGLNGMIPTHWMPLPEPPKEGE